MDWFELKDSSKIESPCLLIYPDRIQYNAELMLNIAGKAARLRPHIKTHKMAEIIEIQLRLGISKFKCATIAEAELLAKSGALDVLLAMQPVSMQLERFLQLIENYPKVRFSTLVDNKQSYQEISKAALNQNIKIGLWLDLNNGMNRTGVIPGKEAEKLFKSLYQDDCIDLKGLHAYDGHIHANKLDQRTSECDKDYEAISLLIQNLEESGFPKPLVIAGGTPTFPIHKKREHVELSPGTPLLWDQGYSSNFMDLKFMPAAVLVTRIVSKPAKNLLCLDLGHKSVASEMNLPRVHFLRDNNFKQISQSEEHLVVDCATADSHKIGDTFYALPYHICPTVAKFPYAYTVKNNEIIGKWEVAARDH